VAEAEPRAKRTSSVAGAVGAKTSRESLMPVRVSASGRREYFEGGRKPVEDRRLWIKKTKRLGPNGKTARLTQTAKREHLTNKGATVRSERLQEASELHGRQLSGGNVAG